MPRKKKEPEQVTFNNDTILEPKEKQLEESPQEAKYIHVPSQKYLDGMAPNEAVPEDIIRDIDFMMTYRAYYEAYKLAEKNVKKYIDEHYGQLENSEYEILIRTKSTILCAKQKSVNYEIGVQAHDKDRAMFPDESKITDSEPETQDQEIPF